MMARPHIIRKVRPTFVAPPIGEYVAWCDETGEILECGSALVLMQHIARDLAISQGKRVWTLERRPS